DRIAGNLSAQMHGVPYVTGSNVGTVMARKDCGPDPARTAAEPDRAGDAAIQTEKVRADSGTLMRLSIDGLLQLAPRLRTYLSTSRPVWRDIVDAADWLRGEMGISRPPEHFRTSP